MHADLIEPPHPQPLSLYGIYFQFNPFYLSLANASKVVPPGPLPFIFLTHALY